MTATGRWPHSVDAALLDSDGPREVSDYCGLAWYVRECSQIHCAIIPLLVGTMSLNEIAVDLTCESEDFEPATASIPETEEEEEGKEEEEIMIPGKTNFPKFSTTSIPDTTSTTPPRYHVHSGMLRMARAMGALGKPVQLAVREAMECGPGYGELSIHQRGVKEVDLIPPKKSCYAVTVSGQVLPHYLAWSVDNLCSELTSCYSDQFLDVGGSSHLLDSTPKWTTRWKTRFCILFCTSVSTPSRSVV